MRSSLTLVLAATCSGCFLADSAGPPGPIPKTTTPLETVPFAAIGSGTIMFERSLAGIALYVVDGNAQTSRIAFSDALIRGATISPDGQRVVFTRPTELEFGYDIFVVSAAGTGELRVTRSAAYEGMPTWSYDGSLVVYPVPMTGPPAAFLRQSPVANAPNPEEIVRFEFQSGQAFACPYAEFATPGVLSAKGDLSFPCGNAIYKKPSAANTTALYTAPAANRVHAPSWSSDGALLAFVELDGTSLLVQRITESGANPVTLATLPTAAISWAIFNIYSLCWSADDARLFFSVPSSANVAHVWMVRADGSGVQQITTRPNVFDHNISCAS